MSDNFHDLNHDLQEGKKKGIYEKTCESVFLYLNV